MIQMITFRIGNRVYRADNPTRVGFIKAFTTKKTGGRPHRYAVVIVHSVGIPTQEHWRLDWCRHAN